jgi:hypothetical protein
MKRKKVCWICHKGTGGWLLPLLLLFLSSYSYAIPIFARKYGKPCITCHVSEPMLNEFGRRFQANGYQIPFAKPKTPVWDQVPLVLAFAIAPTASHVRTEDKLTGTKENSSTIDAYGVDLLTAGDFSSKLSWYGDLTVDPDEGAGIESLFLIYHLDRINFGFGKQILRTLFPIQFTPAFATDYLAQSYDPYAVSGAADAGSGMPVVGDNPLLIQEASYGISAFGWVPDVLDGFRYEAAFTTGAAGTNVKDNRAIFLSADQTIFYANNAPFRVGVWYYGGQQKISPTAVDSSTIVEPTNKVSRFAVGVDVYDPWTKRVDLMGQYMTAKDDKIFNGTDFGEQKMNGGFVALAAVLYPEKFYVYGRWDMLKIDELDLKENQYTVALRYHFLPNVYLFGEAAVDNQKLKKPTELLEETDLKTTILSVGTGFAF